MGSCDLRSDQKRLSNKLVVEFYFFSMVRVVAGGAEVRQHKWKEEVDKEKQHVRDTIIKCEEEEVDIATQITFLETMLKQQKQALIDKKKETDEHREHLVNFDSRRYIELG